MSKKVAPEVQDPVAQDVYGTSSSEEVASENEAFEMIEMAIDDIDLLTRAFHVIQKVCDEASDAKVEIKPPEKIIQ